MGIPEPETYALMLAGLGLIGFMARRKAADGLVNPHGCLRLGRTRPACLPGDRPLLVILRRPFHVSQSIPDAQACFCTGPPRRAQLEIRPALTIPHSRLR